MRALARADHTAHDDRMAHALMVYGADRAEAGRLPEAVATTTESVAIRHRLFRNNPAAYTRDLTQSLSNLALLLVHARQPSEALSAAEAVSLIELAQAPELHGAHFGRCLSILAVCLNANDRQPGRLPAGVDAVRQYEAVWKADPVRYAFDLARVLARVGQYLADEERWSEALTPLEDGLAVTEAYAHVDPATYAPLISDLRTALNDCQRRITVSPVGRLSMGGWGCRMDRRDRGPQAASRKG
ncbi:hypothetical protein [Streptomyces sp. NRRL B-3229]|uniref:hypothetical protein n=1 Tax=Streptomyces sp. NRRL B-3229 TaxID=1463836 RepID=UPI00131E2E52|nr:hypothetical protein [Streptomyces sp. NRRL B-3229]